LLNIFFEIPTEDEILEILKRETSRNLAALLLHLRR